MTSNYEDIINLPHHTSRNHPQMTMLQRAAQFAPFAALTGHDAAIEETARLTDDEVDLSENGRELLDRKLSYLMSCGDNPTITITFFVPDEKKQGGAYASLTGQIKKIDGYERFLIMTDGSKISFEHVADIDGNVFDELEVE